MKRVLGHCLAGATLIVGGVAFMAACVHDDESFFVQDVMYPLPAAAGSPCTFLPQLNATFLPRGVLDVAFRLEYDPWYLLGNQLVSRANPTQLQVESSTINLEGAVVRITDAGGNQLANYTTLTSGTIYPGVSGIAGLATASITALDSTTVGNVVKSNAKLLSGGGTVTLVSYAKFFGHTLGGTYIESNEFEFPVEICEGCLVLFTVSDVDTTTPGVKTPNCLGNQSAGGGGTSLLSVPCTTGQDTPIDCSSCRGTPVCEGAYANGGAPMLDGGGGG